MKINVSEATPIQLNWLVAKIEGKNITLMRNDDGSLFPMPVWEDGLWSQNYATSWAQGGPIIEREVGNLWRWNRNDDREPVVWCAVVYKKMPDRVSGYQSEGPTPLIAAMRCYVTSKLGDEVDIPKELL